MASSYHKALTIGDVEELGEALIYVADKYPTQFLTERDFYPLVVAYLRGRVPKVDTEVSAKTGAIDFRIGGTNPALLELAVVPRALADRTRDGLTFSGHGKAIAAYASQNRTELGKLLQIPQTQAKGRYLLLLDFMDYHQKADLEKKYKAEAAALPGVRPVRIVYVSPSRSFHFSVRGR